MVADLVGDRAGDWDLAGAVPGEVIRKLGSAGLLCAQVSARHGGLGLNFRDDGQWTAYVGSLCSSLRSLMTSQGMAAWSVSRFGDEEQRAGYLSRLTGGDLAAVGFTEAGAGSDLSAMRARIRRDGDSIVVDGHKRWMTGARYADLLLVFGRFEDGAAAVMVPAEAAGVSVEPVADPSGCRAAGHADVRLNEVRLPSAALLGGVALPLPLLVTTALGYGRLSVAWGCVGILRACLASAAAHAQRREQFGVPLKANQLIARHLAGLFSGEQIATRLCEHASACWDTRSPELVVATVLAKQVAAEQAVRGAATAAQVLASAGAHGGHVVARAHRDAKLMEIIEGTAEISQLILADHVTAHSPLPAAEEKNL
ncbi:acyl-CoA dehydrogenase family protein [Amycolatopsis sp. NPDC004079]